MSKASILIVDDTPTNLQVLASMLNEQGYKVRPANSGRVALRTVRMQAPDMILLDINMPDMDGYEVCELLKADDELRDIPVIFISALDDLDDKVRAFQVGGLDYITKPFQFDEVLARVETHLNLRRKQQQVEDLRRQEKVYYEKLSQMKDEVVRNASHDLKNPLSSVASAVSLLEQHLDTDDEHLTHLLDMIRRGADRMLALITDVLDLARLETGMALLPESVYVNDYLALYIDEFIPLADDKNITLTFNPLADELVARFDPAQMGQLLRNLLSNAIKYTPVGGQVEVSVEVGEYVWMLHISDTGLGIPEAELPHLFEKFYRINTREHMQQEGTGIGLTIVKAIVEQHHGEITVDSQYGQGTTFSIILPQQGPDTEQEA